MKLELIEDKRKDILLFVNELPTKYITAMKELSVRLGRPLRAVLLVDEKLAAKSQNSIAKHDLYEIIVTDYSSITKLKETIKPLENNLLLVVCPLEKSQRYFKRLIPHVPYLNVPTESSIDYCTDKGKMRQLLSAYDENVSTKSVIVYDSTAKSVGEVLKKLKFPVMVKPASLASSKLVSKVNDKEKLGSVLSQSFAYLKEICSKGPEPGNCSMVVEEFVEGDLYSTDVYVNAVGKVYALPFNRFLNGNAAGMDSFQVYQGETYINLTEDEKQKGVIAATKAIHAVGLRSSVAHIELFHQGNDWKIIELGARPGGWRQEMYQLSYSVDHALNELLIKVGLEPIIPKAIYNYVITFSVHAPRAGRIEEISGIKEVKSHPCFYKMFIKYSVGDRVLANTQGGGAIIDGLMYHQDYEELKQAVKFARAKVKIIISDDKSE